MTATHLFLQALVNTPWEYKKRRVSIIFCSSTPALICSDVMTDLTTIDSFFGAVGIYRFESLVLFDTFVAKVNIWQHRTQCRLLWSISYIECPNSFQINSELIVLQNSFTRLLEILWT